MINIYYYCKIIIIMNTKLNKLGCGGFLVFTKDKKQIVLVKTPRGVYGFPKGKIKQGETNYDCAFRELHEETSLTANDIESLGDAVFLDELSHRGQPAIRLYVAYLKDTVDVKKIAPLDKDELDNAVLVDVDEANKVLMDKRKTVLSDALILISK
jgi:8-oxo-dGTP pyrophosphatase MutT (NUDIX family)